MDGRGGGRGGLKVNTNKPHIDSPGNKQSYQGCIHTPLVCKAVENVSDVNTTSSSFANASVSVNELAYDTDQYCDSGSHWDVGECKSAQ